MKKGNETNINRQEVGSREGLFYAARLYSPGFRSPETLAGRPTVALRGARIGPWDLAEGDASKSLHRALHLKSGMNEISKGS